MALSENIQFRTQGDVGTHIYSLRQVMKWWELFKKWGFREVIHLEAVELKTHSEVLQKERDNFLQFTPTEST